MAMVAICIGDAMSTEQHQEPFGDATARSMTPTQGLTREVNAGSQYEEVALGPEDWRDPLSSLQQRVCELLIKNQELRKALESLTTLEKEKQDG
jgi:hypothetical protein